MQVSRPGERLPNNSRADNFSVAHNQLPIGLVAEKHLRQAGHHQRIDDPQQYRGDDRHQNCNLKILFHRSPSYASPTPMMSMSISLIPMKGTMIPPTP